jgi:hypothetical protein
LCWSSQSATDALLKNLDSRTNLERDFALKDIGDLHYFLGIGSYQDQGGNIVDTIEVCYSVTQEPGLKNLERDFALKDIGDLHYFLGIGSYQDQGGNIVDTIEVCYSVTQEGRYDRLQTCSYPAINFGQAIGI